MAIQLLILAFFLLVLPVLAGGILGNVDKGVNQPLLMWISGQLCLWAGFQLICVPFVLLEGSFRQVVYLFSFYSAGLACAGVGMWIHRRKSGEANPLFSGRKAELPDKGTLALWLVFWAVLLFQLVQAVRLTYADGDDAFYVAISTITREGEQMYRQLPYTGGTTGLDARHGLAPFPVWIAYLSRVSGMEAVSVAHVVLPVVLISMTYGILALLGSRLFPEKGKSLALFLCFSELLVLFGDYSFCTVENFMLARSRQGKAALGSIVLPFLFYLLLVWLKSLEEGKRLSVKYYLLLLAAVLTGCLCSTLGAMLICLLAGVTGLAGAAAYKKIRPLVPLALCCLPCVCYAVLYLLQD